MHIIPFKAEHFKQLILQPAQQYAKPLLLDQNYGEALQHGDAFTAMLGDKVLGCGGMIQYWEGRGQVWAVVDQDAGRDFVKIHRAVMRFLEVSSLRRIEAHVDEGFEAGHRWIKMLGFQHEGLMRGFTPAGLDCHLYARVK